MLEQKLPKALKGDWIWLSQPHSEANKYCYFRHDINLDQTPRTAELRIAAFSTFHLFINGRHIYFGESSLKKSQTYVHIVDVSFCLQPGNNLIAISVFNSDKPQFNNFSHKSGGLWAELIINDETRLTTGKEWYVRSADCLYSCNLSKTSRGGFTEKLDFNKVVRSWIHSSEFSKDNWGHPDVVKPVNEVRSKFAPDTITGLFCRETYFKKAVSQGKILKHNFSSGVEYSSIMDRSGVYVAEGYFYADSPGPVDFSFFCDSPYKLFINDKLVKENAISETVNGEALSTRNKLHEFDNPKGRMIIADGWNKICVIQELEFSSYGFTLNMDADPIQFNILRTHDSDSLPGWSIAGPIKTPLDRSHGVMWFESEEFSSFYTIGPVDESAYHESLRFKAYDKVPQVQLDRFSIAPEEFIVLDLGQIHYALPQLTIEGTKGDIVDIVCADKMTDKFLAPFSTGRTRNADSVILDGSKNRWIDFHPRGFRYLMIVARKVAKDITISHINAKTISRDFVELGFFESSDKLLNLIWEQSCNTLDATVNFRMLDGAGREHSQYIADSLIQSRVGFITKGDFNSSLKALREFAAIEYESGEIPAMHPTDIPFHLLDFSLHYMEWLRHHYLYTGDKAVLEEFEPVLYKFFAYMQNLQVPGEEVLFLHPGTNEYFIDLNMPEIYGVATAINALYCRALLNGSIIMDTLGRTDYAVQLHQKAQTVAATINNLCWDEKQQSFSDYWYDNSLAENCSWQTNILASYGGIATEEQTEIIMKKLFSNETPYGNFIDEKFFTPYFMYFVMEVLFSQEETELGVNFMRYFWGGILGAGDQKTWPEIFAPRHKEKPTIGGSLCMGYSVSPAIFLIRDIAGISPADPGYGKIYFSPAVELVDKLKVQIPTVDGAIFVNWKRNENGTVLIDLDANHPLKVIPHFSSNKEIDIEFRISDMITITED